MNQSNPVDYEAALEEFRKEEHRPDNPVRSSRNTHNPPLIDGCVDYQAVIRAWNKAQAGKYTVYTVDQEEECIL